jgi:hypothetical protein
VGVHRAGRPRIPRNDHDDQHDGDVRHDWNDRHDRDDDDHVEHRHHQRSREHVGDSAQPSRAACPPFQPELAVEWGRGAVSRSSLLLLQTPDGGA